MLINWGRRLWGAIKCSFSALASIFLLYFVLGLISTIFNGLYKASNTAFLGAIGKFLAHLPMILSIHCGSTTLDLAPLLVVAAAGVWGWVRQPAVPERKKPMNMR